MITVSTIRRVRLVSHFIYCKVGIGSLKQLNSIIVNDCKYIQNTIASMRIWDRIDPPQPLLFHKRPLNGVIHQMRLEKLRPPVTVGVA
jgi:hypothetical protein